MVVASDLVICHFDIANGWPLDRHSSKCGRPGGSVPSTVNLFARERFHNIECFEKEQLLLFPPPKLNTAPN
jgi:hypothetical protein